MYSRTVLLWTALQHILGYTVLQYTLPFDSSIAFDGIGYKRTLDIVYAILQTCCNEVLL